MSSTYRWVFVSIMLFASLAFASLGDRAEQFQRCLSLCSSRICSPTQPKALPFPLRLTGWTCEDDCKYSCMHLITEQAIEAGSRIHQYYGKWPFWRFCGMQEPASVLFSLLNLLFHAEGVYLMRSKIPDGHPMKGYYTGFALVSVNAWIWSAVFHTRDLPNTEKMDYFSAAAAILYALYYTVIRMFHLYSTRHRLEVAPSTRPAILKPWTALCLILFIGHVSYLSLLPRFDYTYNMAFNLVIGLLHNLLWLLYSLPTSLIRRFPSRPRTYRPKCAWKAALFVFLTTAATSLELFDFPPWWRVIDAHALWHLATVPIAASWYDFLVEDALDEGWRALKH